MKLEHFSCTECWYFNASALAYAHLPRLNFIEIYGIETCPDQEFAKELSRVEWLICVPHQRFKLSECGDYWQHRLEYDKDRIRRATRSECYEPVCGLHFDKFDKLDSDNNGLLHASEFISSSSFDRLFIKSEADLSCTFQKNKQMPWTPRVAPAA